MNCTFHTYAVDEQRENLIYARDGRLVRDTVWACVLEIQAPRAARALRAADAKWPGKLHRARLIQAACNPATVLCADDRALIHQLTTQTL